MDLASAVRKNSVNQRTGAMEFKTSEPSGLKQLFILGCRTLLAVGTDQHIEILQHRVERAGVVFVYERFGDQ